MTLPGTVVSAPSGVLGFDTDGVVDPWRLPLRLCPTGTVFAFVIFRGQRRRVLPDLTTSEALGQYPQRRIGPFRLASTRDSQVGCHLAN